MVRLDLIEVGDVLLVPVFKLFILLDKLLLVLLLLVFALFNQFGLLLAEVALEFLLTLEQFVDALGVLIPDLVELGLLFLGGGVHALVRLFKLRLQIIVVGDDDLVLFVALGCNVTRLGRRVLQVLLQVLALAL